MSEYHTGFRAFRKEVLTKLPLLENSDDFVFDNEMLAQSIYFGYRIGEISCPTKYFEEASSINFARSVKYGFGVLHTTLKCWLQSLGIARYRLFSPPGKNASDGLLPPSSGAGSASGREEALSSKSYGVARIVWFSNPSKFSACSFEGSRRTAISASEWAMASSPR